MSTPLSNPEREERGLAPRREVDREKTGKERAGGSINLTRRPIKLPKMKRVKQ